MMGVRTPGAPCNDCSRYTSDCPFNNLSNPNPYCVRWKVWVELVELKIIARAKMKFWLNYRLTNLKTAKGLIKK